MCKDFLGGPVSEPITDRVGPLSLENNKAGKVLIGIL
jgi:hypothetical protein